ncbi:hypothetical protein [Niastella sp. OAS944]|nr:hypothetical protein [Chitinophagaceae bacterium OAS944]
MAVANPLNPDLGFTPAINNFSLSTLPQYHQVFAASTSGSTVGDPRWTY